MLRNKESQLQLLWWVKNIEIYNGRTLIQFPAQALFKDRGEGSQGRNENWRDMDSAGQKDTPKRTGTSCIKTSPGNLFESTGDKVTAYSDRQYSGLDLLSENGCSKNLQMVCLSKQIWEVLLRKKGTVIAEYFPKALNKHADIEYCRKTDSSEWKLAPSVFQRLCENGKDINRPLCFQGVSLT